MLVETNISMIYMSLLAKYLSGIDTDATVTGTDREEYLRLSYVPLSGESSIECLDIRFANILPVPREDVPLDRILEFRSDEDRRMEFAEETSPCLTLLAQLLAFLCDARKAYSLGAR
jgi:hypothetical protein